MFLSYLWGIETWPPALAAAAPAAFLSYLWGIETGIAWWAKWPDSSFYRTYEELKPNSFTSICLPSCCFYRTYEELKPGVPAQTLNRYELFLSYLWGIETRVTFVDQRDATAFLSYLRGIETRFDKWLHGFLGVAPLASAWIKNIRTYINITYFILAHASHLFN